MPQRAGAEPLPVVGCNGFLIREEPGFRTLHHEMSVVVGSPRRLFPLAVVALVVALTSGPVALILSLAAAGLYLGDRMVGGAIALCLLASALPAPKPVY